MIDLHTAIGNIDTYPSPKSYFALVTRLESELLCIDLARGKQNISFAEFRKQNCKRSQQASSSSSFKESDDSSSRTLVSTPTLSCSVAPSLCNHPGCDCVEEEEEEEKGKEKNVAAVGTRAKCSCQGLESKVRTYCAQRSTWSI